MSDYYDEEPEPTEQDMEENEIAQLAKDTPIEIKGLTGAAVMHVIRGAIEGNWRLTEKINDAIEKAIQKRVSALIDETIKERIVAAIDASIAEGFPVYDTYNGREVSRTSVAEMVQKALTARGDNFGSYDHRNKTIAEAAVTKAVDALFQKELADVTKSLVANFKKQADEVFQAKIVAGLKEAIGLRP
jgi:6-phosphogluconate dehydrogenase (decarboxylating)